MLQKKKKRKDKIYLVTKRLGGNQVQKKEKKETLVELPTCVQSGLPQEHVHGFLQVAAPVETGC